MLTGKKKSNYPHTTMKTLSFPVLNRPIRVNHLLTLLCHLFLWNPFSLTGWTTEANCKEGAEEGIWKEMSALQWLGRVWTLALLPGDSSAQVTSSPSVMVPSPLTWGWKNQPPRARGGNGYEHAKLSGVWQMLLVFSDSTKKKKNLCPQDLYLPVSFSQSLSAHPERN